MLAKESRPGSPHPVHEGGGRVPSPWVRPLSRGPPDAPPTSTPTLYIPFRGDKNQRESFIAFYDTEPPPSPKTSREGWSGVRSGLRRGESVAIVIINHPPSPISWCSPLCVSNSIVGLLDGDGLDEMYHVIELVLLEFDPYYPLCSEIDVAMTLLCLMLVTRARVPWFQIWTYYVYEYMCVLDPILQVYSHLLCVIIRQPRSDNNRDTSRWWP